MGTGCSSQRTVVASSAPPSRKPTAAFRNGTVVASLTSTDIEPSNANVLLAETKRPLSKPTWGEVTTAVKLMPPVMQVTAARQSDDNLIDIDAQTELTYKEEDYDWYLSEKNDAETQTYVRDSRSTSAVGQKRDANVQTDQRITVLARKVQVELKPTVGQIVVQDSSSQTETDRTTSGTQTGPRTTPEVQNGPSPGRSSPSEELPDELKPIAEPYIDGEEPPIIDKDPKELRESSTTDSEAQVESVENLSRRVAVGAMEVDFTPAFDNNDVENANVVTPPRPKHGRLRDKTKDTAMQTDNDILTDEAPEFSAKPPSCKKAELLTDPTIFDDADEIALGVKIEGQITVEELVSCLIEDLPSDLLRVRAIFRWVTENISYDWRLVDTKMTTKDVIEKRSGACRDYVGLFTEMCECARIRVKKLHGFAKGYDYRPGSPFQPGRDMSHAWNAVFINGSWRFIDTTWGAGYSDYMGEFHRQLVEHYFFTDPEDMIWTHFPYDEVERNYSRWQLLDEPIVLDHFNKLPKVTPHFFAYNLKIRTPLVSPSSFMITTNVMICAPAVMRYKYKLFPTTEAESTVLNQYVFCWLREQRLVGQFTVQPPAVGKYYIKIYAKPEYEMEEGAQLECVCMFMLICGKVRDSVDPWPASEMPWGITEAFYDTHAGLVDQYTPIITIWGGKKNLVIRKARELLIFTQFLDSDGNALDQKGIIGKDETPETITITIHPQAVGYYKLMLFGTAKPREKGRVRLPLIATFLVACKMINKQESLNKERRPKFLPKRV